MGQMNLGITLGYRLHSPQGTPDEIEKRLAFVADRGNEKLVKL